MVGTPLLAMFALSLQEPDSLTLTEALDRARAARPQISVAAAGTARARGTRDVVSAIPNPTGQVQGDGLTPVRTLSVTQPLAWIPRRAADREAGRAGVIRAEADSADAVANVALDVRRAFFGALAADEQLRLALVEAVLGDSLVSLAERRVAAGDISELERDQVAQAATRARLAVMRARETSRTARVDLARAVAADPDSLPRPAGDLAEGLAGTRSPAREVSDVSELPVVRGALADSVASAARLRAAVRGRIPVPGLIVEYEWAGDAASHDRVRLGLAMPLPIWSQGRERVAEARGAAAEDAARAGEIRLALTARLRAGSIRMEEAAERARFTQDSLIVQARRVRVRAVRLYAAGETGVFPVLEALRAERDAAQLAVEELLAFQDARAQVAALRGEWE